MINIRFQYESGAALAISIEQLGTGLYYDFSAGSFLARSGATVPTIPLPEDTGMFLGGYALTMNPTPNPPFADGDYCITVHQPAGEPLTPLEPPVIVARLALTMFNGSDASVFPPRYWLLTGSTHQPK